MLLIANAAGLAKTFEVEDAFSGKRHRATVAWIDGKRIGVRFEGAVEVATQQQAHGFGRRKA